MRPGSVRRAGSVLLAALVVGLMATPVQAAVVKSPTLIRVDPVAPVAWGQRAMVTAHLTLSNGAPVADHHVDLHLNGDVAGGRTDAVGKATFDTKTPTLPGIYAIRVTFSGSSTLLPSQAGGTLTVKPRTLTIHTVPAQEGLPFVLNGTDFLSDTDGIAQIVVSPDFDDTLRPATKDLTVAPGVEQRFARWRTHNGEIYATYEMYYHISLRFVDLAGNRIDPARVAQVDFKSAIGALVRVSPNQPFTVLGQRVVALAGELQAKDVTYAAQDVLVDGSSVVHVAQQRFTPSLQRLWTITLLFYSAHISVRDALFGFPLDATVAVTYPDGHVVSVPTEHGNLSLLALARGDYHVVARGWGISFSRPISLSRDQQVELKFISYLDVGVVVGLVLLGGLGLVVLGRPGLARAFGTRVRRRSARVAAAAFAVTAPLTGAVASGPRLVRAKASGVLSLGAGSRSPAKSLASSAAVKATRVARPQASRVARPQATRMAKPEATQVAEPQAPPAAEPPASRVAKPQATRVAKPQASRVAKVYIVRAGDTLRSIAAEWLGDANSWPEILYANPDVLADPDRILPGTRLKIR